MAHWWHLTEEENDILLHAKQKLQSLYKHLVHCQHGKFPDLTVWAQSLYDVFGIDYNTWLNRKTQKVAVCLISSSGEYLAHVFLFLNRSIPYECEMFSLVKEKFLIMVIMYDELGGDSRTRRKNTSSHVELKVAFVINLRKVDLEGKLRSFLGTLRDEINERSNHQHS